MLTSQHKYVRKLAGDLELLLRTGYALRSIPESDIECWLAGQETLTRPHHPCPNDITYTGQPIIGLVKEYEVKAPTGEHYRFVIHPQTKEGIQNNKVAIKYGKTHPEGKNTNPGEKTQSDNHDVLYLLPWIYRLPAEIEDITHKSVVEFFEKNNGFKTHTRQAEKSTFYDTYNRFRTEKTKEKPLIHNGKPSEKYRTFTAHQDALDVYITIKPKRAAVELTLEIELPRKP